MTIKTQCPFKLVKYCCEYGRSCSADLKDNCIPSWNNECSVAIRQKEGHPWRNERDVVYDEKSDSFKPKGINKK